MGIYLKDIRFNKEICVFPEGFTFSVEKINVCESVLSVRDLLVNLLSGALVRAPSQIVPYFTIFFSKDGLYHSFRLPLSSE